jgi:N-acetylated-alpha-linked acidic dipeptidase
LPRIPAAVLSWSEAKKILAHLDGAEATPSFRGGLPITYRFGGKAVRVRLRVEMDNGLRPIRDIVARVPGARRADREVILGTHHDAWTFGGVDPGTGTAALLELGRTLGALRRGGWQPQRTIALAFWDAEEFGLVGSTEYAEDRRQALRDGAICYINTDLYMNGRLDAGGTPSLRDFVVEVAKDMRTEAARSTTAGKATRVTRISRRWAAARTSCRSRTTSACRPCRSSSTRPAATPTVRITPTTTRASSSNRWPIRDSRAA